MADKIRGLSVEISADAKKFNQGMRELRRDAKTSQQELNALQKSLRLDYDNKTFLKAQQTAQKAIDETAKNAKVLDERLKHLESIGSINTAEYKKLQKELIQTNLKSKQLEKQLNQINDIKLNKAVNNIKKVGTGIENTGNRLKGVSTAAVAAAGALGKLVTEAISTADDIATSAVKYGLTAEAMQELNYVALQSDVAANDMGKAMIKARAAIADMSTGVISTASKSLQELNIDFNNFKGTDDKFYAIIESLSQLEDETKMVSVANEIFGEKLANNIIPLIASGSGAIASYKEEFKQTNALTNTQVRELAAFDNVLNKVKQQIKNTALQIGASLLPIMKKVSGIVSTSIMPKLNQVVEMFNKLSEKQQALAMKVLGTIASIAPALIIVGKMTKGLGSIVRVISKLSPMLSILAAHPIIAIMTGVAALLGILYTKNENFRTSINNLITSIGSALAPVLDVIINTFKNIIQLLSPIIQQLGDVLAIIINTVVIALNPFIQTLGVLFQAITPLINLAIIPLQMAIRAIQPPLSLIAKLLKWLAPLFTWFAKVVEGAFTIVMRIVNSALKGVERGINFVVDIINSLINTYNNTLGRLGAKKLDLVGRVNLQVNRHAYKIGDTTPGSIPDEPKMPVWDTNRTPTAKTTTEYSKISKYGYDQFKSVKIPTNNVNYNTIDNSTKNQTVHVTIENYASDVDTDQLIVEINKKLALAM